jgi:hypothetical protein
MMRILIFAIVSITIVSCAEYSRDIKSVLRFAGSNRCELEKTLEYYRNDPEDSLKFKAAEFLILNMPGLYTRISSRSNIYIDACRRYIHNGKDPHTVIDSLNKFCFRDKDSVLFDVHSITSRFLIDNIEHSFKVWKEQPWGKWICFEDFCEYILPYRIKDEKLEMGWKKKYYDHYQFLLDTFPCDDVIEVCRYLNKQLMRDGWYYTTASVDQAGLPAFSPAEADEIRIGTCPQRVTFGVYVMRSLGIPVSIDFIEQWPYRSKRHQWNAVMDSERKMHLFVVTDSNPENEELRKRGKMYRQTTSIQPDQLIPVKEQEGFVPAFFQQSRVIDVTREYLKDVIDIKIDLVAAKLSGNRLAYLSVFNNQDWVPISWGKIDGNQATFRAIEKGIAGMVLTDENGQLVPCSYPFAIEEDGSIRYFIPDRTKPVAARLKRKYAPIGFGSKSHEEMEGGLFQGDNDPSFSHPVTFYQIKDGTKVCLYNKVAVSTLGSYRYVRYYSAPNSYCNIAEMHFYNAKGEVLNGKRIGTDCSFRRLYRPDNVFDNDILTFYYSCKPSDAWVGLDLNKPEVVRNIIFVPRNDDNYIAPFDTYELQYLDPWGWHALGIRQVSSDEIRYNEDPALTVNYDSIPSGALFRLLNHTRGTEVRIFSYENGEQVWW